MVLSTNLQPRGPGETAGPFVFLSVYCEFTDRESRPAELHPWIGMATTEAIVAQYGGTMTAAVEPSSGDAGAGVRYSLFLPAVSETTPKNKVPAPPDTHGTGGGYAASVLLVEEEPLIRELSRDMLERQGFRVLTAGNAAEAERIARGQETFDILITAWAADGRAGGGLVPLLRGMRPGLRVLFIAGYSDRLADPISPPDGSAILQKPFSGDSLGRKIRLLLERTEAADA